MSTTTEISREDWLECPCCGAPAFAPLPATHVDGTPSPCGCPTWWSVHDEDACEVAWDEGVQCMACTRRDWVDGLDSEADRAYRGEGSPVLAASRTKAQAPSFRGIERTFARWRRRRPRRRPRSARVAGGGIEVTTLFGYILGVEGLPPTVLILSDFDGVLHVARTSRSLARRAATQLYQPVEATVAILHGERRHLRLRLEEFHVTEALSPEQEIARWRQWFADAKLGWDDVDDIEAELGRKDP